MAWQCEFDGYDMMMQMFLTMSDEMWLNITVDSAEIGDGTCSLPTPPSFFTEDFRTEPAEADVGRIRVGIQNTAKRSPLSLSAAVVQIPVKMRTLRRYKPSRVPDLKQQYCY